MKKVLVYVYLILLAGMLAFFPVYKNKTFANVVPPQQDTACICHKQGNSWVYKVVGASSLNGHLAHGDFLYKGRPDVELWEMTDWCVINAPQK